MFLYVLLCFYMFCYFLYVLYVFVLVCKRCCERCCVLLCTLSMCLIHKCIAVTALPMLYPNTSALPTYNQCTYLHKADFVVPFWVLLQKLLKG